MNFREVNDFLRRMRDECRKLDPFLSNFNYIINEDEVIIYFPETKLYNSTVAKYPIHKLGKYPRKRKYN